MIMFGGMNQEGLSLSDLWVLHPGSTFRSMLWEEVDIPGPAPSARNCHSRTVAQETSSPNSCRLFLCGGLQQSERTAHDTWCLHVEYHEDAQAWGGRKLDLAWEPLPYIAYEADSHTCCKVKSDRSVRPLVRHSILN